MKAKNGKAKLNKSALLCRAAAFLLILNILTICMTGGIFAKFTGYDESGDIARVAAFGLTISGTGVEALKLTPDNPTDDYDLTVKGVTEVDAQLDIVVRIPGYDNVIAMLEEYYKDDSNYTFYINKPLPDGLSFSIVEKNGESETVLPTTPRFMLVDRTFGFEVDGENKLFKKELLIIFEKVKVYDVGTIVPEDLPDKLAVRASFDGEELEDILFAGFKEVDIEAYVFQLD